MGVNKMLVLNCQKMLEINCHFLLESTCRLQELKIMRYDAPLKLLSTNNDA